MTDFRTLSPEAQAEHFRNLKRDGMSVQEIAMMAGKTPESVRAIVEPPPANAKRIFRILVDVVEVDADGRFIRDVDENLIIKEFNTEERAGEFVSYIRRTTFGGEDEKDTGYPIRLR